MRIQNRKIYKWIRDQQVSKYMPKFQALFFYVLDHERVVTMPTSWNNVSMTTLIVKNKRMLFFQFSPEVTLKQWTVDLIKSGKVVRFSSFHAAKTECHRLGYLQWKNTCWLMVLETWKSKVEGLVSGKGLAASTHGKGAKRWEEEAKPIL